MELLYNVNFEVAAAIYMAILYIFLKIQYEGHSKGYREFQKLMLLILLADIMDVITAFTISYAMLVPIWLNMLINTVYFSLDAAFLYKFVNYVVFCASSGKKGALGDNILNKIIWIGYAGTLFYNLFSGVIFSFSREGEYRHGILYPIVYAAPVYFILYAAVVFFSNQKAFDKKQRVSIGSFLILAVLGPVLQMLVFPDVLLSIFTATLAMVIMFFSLETPDYQKLMKTMKELARTREEAEAANQAKTEFLANMSHEIRTPINAVLGNNEMIMGNTGESQTVAYAMNVQAAGRTLLSMVEDILDFTNIDAGAIKLEVAAYSVFSILQDVIVYARYCGEEKNLEIRLDIDEKLPQELSGDAVRLTQIFNNLISNAIKYTNEGFVELIVKWQEPEENASEGFGKMLVQVKDSGIGMKEEDIQRISDSFSRFDNRKTRNIRGLGLGLSIVTRLLDLMGSRLEIESEYEKGSTFSFCISQEIVNAAPIGSIKDDITCYALQQVKVKEKFIAPDARILAVDDNVMNLDLFRGILRDTKMQIHTASNGEEALKLLEKETFHMIFLDHMMPVMDGMETLKEIRDRNLCPGVPIIVLTANAVSGVRESYQQAGFDDYLSKPVGIKQLEAMIRKYLPKELVLEKEEQPQIEELVKEEKEASFLAGLSFLDVASGLAYCAGSEEFYREMLQSYLDNSKYEEIRKFYGMEDWENYRILVHALKSTSLSIGAAEFSNQAKEQELAAKEGRIEDVRKGHEDMMSSYGRLLEQIQNAVKEPGEVKKVDVQPQEAKESILVVDDDVMNLRIAEKMLEEQFRVECVKSGKEALEFLEKEIPNLILLDLHMPEMDGFAVMERIQADERYRDIPVIFLTADNDRETEVKGFREGALDFITKPFIADIMISRVNRILELSRLQKDLQREVEKQTKKAEERRQKVERLSSQIIQTLAGTIDAKDKYTKGHSSRVAEYSVKIAGKMGKSEKEQEDIYYMGLLHDIGKIGIPDGIINKTSKLTEEEYEFIKAHPLIGAEILENISEMPEIGMGARWHHERYDGKGYPDKLKGMEIPEAARIIGVADAYDAMASKRSYRDVLPQSVVREEIEKGKGTQFDPLIVDKMLELIDEDTAYEMREK
ncbi:MAG: response regulator [Roseburia sp.]|nr:response regulator [Roseburia sp.]MCM1278524.1 response regulator [Robinsoniella sp.]